MKSEPFSHVGILLDSMWFDSSEGKVVKLGKESIHVIVLGFSSAAIMLEDIREEFRYKIVRFCIFLFRILKYFYIVKRVHYRFILTFSFHHLRNMVQEFLLVPPTSGMLLKLEA